MSNGHEAAGKLLSKGGSTRLRFVRLGLGL